MCVCVCVCVCVCRGDIAQLFLLKFTGLFLITCAHKQKEKKD